jgi:hypothetical protein
MTSTPVSRHGKSRPVVQKAAGRGDYLPAFKSQTVGYDARLTGADRSFPCSRASVVALQWLTVTCFSSLFLAVPSQ